jgi:hypothetical protein
VVGAEALLLLESILVVAGVVSDNHNFLPRKRVVHELAGSGAAHLAVGHDVAGLLLTLEETAVGSLAVGALAEVAEVAAVAGATPANGDTPLAVHAELKVGGNRRGSGGESRRLASEISLLLDRDDLADILELAVLELEGLGGGNGGEVIETFTLVVSVVNALVVGSGAALELVAGSTMGALASL